jgi:hypothetical protein
MSTREQQLEASRKQADRNKEQALDALARLGGKLTAEEDIVFSGTKITLPESMDLERAIRFLAQKMQEDERVTAFSRTFNFRPWDGANAVMESFRAAFGMLAQKSTQTMFGENPPQLISIATGPGENVQVPWGAVTLPHLPGVTFNLSGFEHSELGTLFVINAEGPRKFRFEIEGIFNLVEDHLQKHSIYRGKAFDGQEMPDFLDLSKVREDKVVYADEVVTQLAANVWAPLRYAPEHRQLGIPLKRSVLLEGPYGTGKTLAAYLTAKVAAENGWTFILCRPGRDNLKTVMATARLYQPAVVFFEDVDVIANPEGEDADGVSLLLDLFDGLQAKDTEIMAILTTNHPERIHKGMVRPGRLDAVIHIGALDQQGVQRLIEVTVPEDLLGDLDYGVIYEAMEGFLPAFCKEAIDRAMRYSLTRNGGAVTTLVTADFVDAAQGLRPQLELMHNADEHSGPDALEAQLGRIISKKLDQTHFLQGSNHPEGMYRLEVMD